MDDVKEGLRKLIEAMRSHLDSLETDLNRDHGSPEDNKWDAAHGAFAISLVMKGFILLASQFCKQAQIGVAMLAQADKEIAQKVEGKKAQITGLEEVFKSIPDDNPNKSKLMDLLRDITGGNGHDDSTRH